MRTTSQDGLTFIEKWEGLVLCEYNDCVGIRTVGYGHVVLPGEDFSGGVTKERAEELLAHDVAKCETAIDRYITHDVTQHEFDALVSLGFNCGTGVYQTSSAAKKLNAGDVAGAADGFLLWCKAGGKTNTGLLNRRKAERAMFLQQDHEPQYEPQAHGLIEEITFEQLALFDVARECLDFTPHRY